jgi:hypothetical protein
MWYFVAFLAGCLIAGLIFWLWKRGNQPTALAGYSPEKAEKERERITEHAKEERDKLADESKQAKDRIDDFFEH